MLSQIYDHKLFREDKTDDTSHQPDINNNSEQQQSHKLGIISTS